MPPVSAPAHRPRSSFAPAGVRAVLARLGRGVRCSILAGVAWGFALGYALVALWIVLDQRIGPIVATVDREGGHGVHAGDLLAVPFLALALASVVVAAAVVDHTRRARPVWRAVPAPRRSHRS